ncbi:MAG: ABC transporter permease [Pseudonocardia sp.]
MAERAPDRGPVADAWAHLRRRPLFVVAAGLVAGLVVLAVAPGLVTSADPAAGDLARSRHPPSPQAWFGYDVQGRDVLARTVYGAQVSIVVGVAATALTVLVGGLAGLVAGYLGGWVDAVVSRVAEVFAGLPFVLGGIVVLATFRERVTGPVGITVLVVATMAGLGWPTALRITRAAAVAARERDHVRAARGLGAGPWRIVARHLLPHCLSPVLAYAGVALGAFIGAEATLSFLGVGLRDPVVSWGVMISESRDHLRTAPLLVLFPAGFLAVTVLAFVMLGDAVRDALDPRARL